eukprot:2166366-Pleurochrysis_carterae.AAC.1
MSSATLHPTPSPTSPHASPSLPLLTAPSPSDSRSLQSLARVRTYLVQSTELRAFAPTHESVVIEACDGLAFRAWDVAYPKLAEQATKRPSTHTSELLETH